MTSIPHNHLLEKNSEQKNVIITFWQNRNQIKPVDFEVALIQLLDLMPTEVLG